MLIPIHAPDAVAACAAAVAAWRPDWAQWLMLLAPEHLHLTLASSSRPSGTLSEHDRAALRMAVEHQVADVAAFELTLGPIREVTYGIELDVHPAADDPFADLAARCRDALGTVLGPDTVATPDVHWTYPHIALAYAIQSGASGLLPGWLAHARTPDGRRPPRMCQTIDSIGLIDADPFSPGGYFWFRRHIVPFGR